MRPWKLTDCLEPFEEPGDFPASYISSETSLREMLSRFRQRQPGLVVLESPDQAYLKIYIGGPHAGLRWVNGNQYSFALADRIVCPEGIEFREEGVDNSFDASEILPAHEVIEAVAHFFKTRQLAGFLRWKKWNEEKGGWDETVPSTIPATAGESVVPPGQCSQREAKPEP